MSSDTYKFIFDQDSLTDKAKLNTSEGLEDFIQLSFEELQKKNAELNEKYGIGSNGGRWDIALRNGTITFSGRGDGKDLVADIEVICSVNRDHDTFMWACDNESFGSLPNIIRASAKTKDFLDDLNYLYMWESPFENPDYQLLRTHIMGETAMPEAWRLSAVASRLSGSIGVYSANVNQAQAIFLLIKGIR